ncbi:MULTISPECIES: DUF192 domain-containing protein [Halorubrum]|uniref:DUF192 domain-containing protein n=1 Tax=Halorubrum sodomense TaxID=35743 RepID=A0A1I6FKG7_HALSD|nr:MULTISPECIES: DUF192 domain-containing protein [Halorubrum]TKX54170.1 DUF192 domain-containing protein [Halorubrum sp. SP3]TKX69712.1 DUF192 domain-containing protein [Halorubrum sp. SP9]SFR30443.1 hypothetical protein SAMN04487937_0266 [Halorubrum sodomense]
MNRRLVGVAAALALIAVAGLGAAAANPTLLITGYDTATVEAVDGETGETLATVEARVADGFVKRYVGLSATDDLDAGEGMLFVHADAAERAYVMRDMAFPLDIVFADANGTVTTIHEAAPESRPLTRYEGTGRYVLEVPRGWSERHGVEPGDRLVIDRS